MQNDSIKSEYGAGRAAASMRGVELVVASLIFALGLLVVSDSWRLGAGWAEDGPQAGYFPFYIGLLLCISSAVIFWRGMRDRRSAQQAFVTHGQFRMVLVLLIPTLFYVIGIYFLGIYVSSILFVALFMVFLGKYHWLRSALVALGVSIAFFLLFEVWFRVPLPKGPLEAVLGLN